MFSLEQYNALLDDAGVLDRTARGRLLLTGADRREYLHGQLTNDILALSPKGSCYAALLTPQGRMISDMRVSELGDRILIDLPPATSPVVRQRLTDFIFSEDVDVTDATDALAQLGLYGPRAAAILDAVRGENPIAIGSEDFGVEGFELFVPAGRRSDLISVLQQAGATPLADETVHVTRVEAGVPEFGADMDEHTIPLEAGIEDRAISLTKGCYVGQEVIVRVLHRGQGRVARRLVGLAAEPGAAGFRAGDSLIAEAAGKPAGTVTSAAFSPRLRRAIGLGYVHRDHVAPGTVLRIGSGPDRGRVTVEALPFIARAAR
jgi:folate-binding protein YgfZ